MKNRYCGLLIGLLLSVGFHLGSSAQVFEALPEEVPEETSAEPTRYTLPKGSSLPVYLQTNINTDRHQVGDPISAVITSDLYIGNRLLLSKNTQVLGSISVLEPPIQGRNAIVGLQFNQLKFSDGRQVPFESHVKTDLPNHTWGGEVTPGTKTYRVTHRVVGIGDYNKTVLGGPRMMGTHLSIPVGERLILILEAPLSLPTGL